MTRTKRTLILATVALLLCFSLTSCGFVAFVKYPEPSGEETFAQKQEEYLTLIAELSSEDYYGEDEQRLYLLALLDAQNELRECTTEDELEAALEKHTKNILEIPTRFEFELLSLMGELEKSLQDGVYRDAEKAELLTLIETTRNTLDGPLNYAAVQVLLTEFQTTVDGTKTDRQYFEEELLDLKNQWGNNDDGSEEEDGDSGSNDGSEEDILTGAIDYSKYRTEHHETIKNTFEQFQENMKNLTSIEEANELFAQYEQAIAAIPTIAEQLKQEQGAWKSAWETKLTAFAEARGLNLDLSEVLVQIERQTSEEAAGKIATQFMLLAAKNNLADCRLIGAEQLTYLVSLKNYQEAQQQEIQTIIADYTEQISSATSYDAIVSLIAQAEEALSAVKTNDALWSEEDTAFLAGMQEKYQGLSLTPPEALSSADNLKELAKIIDYYAFYQLDAQSFERATFRVKLNFSHRYADYVIKDVYWYCELLRSAVGIYGHFEETNPNQLVITLVPYDLASESNTEEPVQVDRYESQIEYSSNSTLTDRAEDFDAFPYYELAQGKDITVWNSQQLWYALEQGYLPRPVAGSSAEKVLERAKEILREIIKDGMTIEEKVFAIYSWYSDNVVYDHQYNKYLYVDDRDNFPDSKPATLMSFHAEGALLENLAVCCSYAKSALILMRMEGIEAYRVILHLYKDNAIGNLGREGYGSHAIIALRASDGKFYYCDVEQSSPESVNDNIYQKFHQLLVTSKEQTPYHNSYDYIWDELDYGETLPTELFWNHLTYQGKSIFVDSEAELRALVDEYIANPGEKSQINLFERGNLDFSVNDILDSYTNIEYINFKYGNLNEYMIHFVEDSAE